MSKYLLIAIFFLTSGLYAQNSQSISNVSSEKSIFLIGESHTVKEKYDEIKAFAFGKMDQLEKGDAISFYFELPYTINYAFYRILEHGDTTVFYEWFNHLYQKKDEPPSFFWTDYRDMILELINYADKKDIEIELKGIDTEIVLRRTAFILSQFDNSSENIIDSLLNLDYLSNDSSTKSILFNQIEKLSTVTQNKVELDILQTLIKSLEIGYAISKERDKFMLSSFMKYYDSTAQLNFISLGLDHIVSKHDFSDSSSFFRMKYKLDTVDYQSFYELMDNDLKAQTMRVGVLELKIKIFYGNMFKRKDYKPIMNSKEREYIEKQLLNKDVYRVNVSKNKALSNLSKELDYLIIYKVSHYRWE